MLLLEALLLFELRSLEIFSSYPPSDLMSSVLIFCPAGLFRSCSISIGCVFREELLSVSTISILSSPVEFSENSTSSVVLLFELGPGVDESDRVSSHVW